MYIDQSMFSHINQVMQINQLKASMYMERGPSGSLSKLMNVFKKMYKI